MSHYHYSADQLSQKQAYKFLTGAIAPRPIAWISTHTLETRVTNLAPFSFFTILSSRIPLVMLSVNRRPDGTPKDTARNLLAAQETKNETAPTAGVIHIVTPELLSAMNQTAASLSFTDSELELLPDELQLLQEKDAPLAVKNAKIRFNVRPFQHQLLTDRSDLPMTDIFYLEVTDFYFDETVFDAKREYILTEKLAPVARLAGNDYSHLGLLETLRRPD